MADSRKRRASAISVWLKHWTLAIAGSLFAGAGVEAQLSISRPLPNSSVSVPLIDNRSQTNLARAAALLESGQAFEAIENLRAVMELPDQPLVALDLEPHVEQLGFQRFVTVQDFGHRWLGSLQQASPEALELYRRQVDPLAELWVREGLEQVDPAAFRRVIDEYYMSSWGDDALYWAGEHARQRGDYAEARMYWEQLFPQLRYHSVSEHGSDAYPLWMFAEIEGVDSSATASLATERNPVARSWLHYPDSDLSLDKVRGGLALLAMLEGNQRRASWERELLTGISPNASGRLGTQVGSWWQLLDALEPAPETETPSSPNPRSRRPVSLTFAGTPARNGVEAGRFGLAETASWSQQLPHLRFSIPGVAPFRLLVAERHDALLSYHPVATEERVYVATGPSHEDVAAFDLQTGAIIQAPRERAASSDANEGANGDSGGDANVVPHYERARGVPRFTLTTYDRFLYTTTGSWGVTSQVAGLDMTSDGKLDLQIELAEPDWSGRWVFEGTPLADADSLYAAVRRIDQVRPSMFVVRFRRSDGQLIWRQHICEAESDPPVVGGYLSNLLSLRGGMLYYNSNMGAVAALRTSDGRPEWIVTYPRAMTTEITAGRNDLHFFRDRTPPLIHRSLVIFAPRDCQRIFALDAATGALIWLTPPEVAADAIHLLGADENQLIVSGEVLYWFDTASGRLQCQYPGSFQAAPGFARPQPRGAGRGLVSGGRVYWPTREAIYVFDQQTVKTDRGWVPQFMERIDLRSRQATGGNLVIAGGKLLIAAPDSLYAFERIEQ